MVPLTESQAKALAAIALAWPDTEILLIGALALGRHIPMSHRTTNDLDLAVAVAIEDFPGPITSLKGWAPHPKKKEHCFVSPDGQEVDLLPAGEALIAQGYVDWPSGHRMSLVGFDLAFAHGTKETAGSTTVLVPPAPVIAFLKMRAWLDRPHRDKDLADIAHLLVLYVDNDDDRRFEDDMLDFDSEAVSPFLLGRDLARIMKDEHAAHVEQFLEQVSPERIAAHGPSSLFSLFSADDAEQALESFRRGLEVGRRSPDRPK